MSVWIKGVAFTPIPLPTSPAKLASMCMCGMQGLQALLTTLIISLPAFYNVGALLMLIFFMYSYVAVLLFGSIQPQDSINDHANFSNFGKHQTSTPEHDVLVGVADNSKCAKQQFLFMCSRKPRLCFMYQHLAIEYNMASAKLTRK